MSNNIQINSKEETQKVFEETLSRDLDQDKIQKFLSGGITFEKIAERHLNYPYINKIFKLLIENGLKVETITPNYIYQLNHVLSENKDLCMKLVENGSSISALLNSNPGLDCLQTLLNNNLINYDQLVSAIRISYNDTDRISYNDTENTKIINFLLQHENFDPNKLDPNFIIASTKNNLELLEQLFEQGLKSDFFKPSERKEGNSTYITSHTLPSNILYIELLLKHGTDESLITKYLSLFDIDFLKAVLDNEIVDVNEFASAISYLQIYSETESSKVINLLLQYEKFDPNKASHYLITYATKNNLELLEQLFERGLKTDFFEVNISHAYHIISSPTNLPYIERLISHGVNILKIVKAINSIDEVIIEFFLNKGLTPKDLIETNSFAFSKVKYLQILLDKGLDINQVLKIYSDENSLIAFFVEQYSNYSNHSASSEQVKEYSDIIRLLINKGANLNSPSPNNNPLLEIAGIQNDAFEILELLLSHGAKNLKVTYQGITFRIHEASIGQNNLKTALKILLHSDKEALYEKSGNLSLMIGSKKSEKVDKLLKFIAQNFSKIQDFLSKTPTEVLEKINVSQDISDNLQLSFNVDQATADLLWFYAVIMQDIELISKLKEREITFSGNQLFDLSIEEIIISTKNLEFIQPFLADFPKLSLFQNAGTTDIMHLIAEKGDYELFISYLEKGLNPDLSNEDGFTAIDIISQKIKTLENFEEVFKKIISYSHDPFYIDSKINPSSQNIFIGVPVMKDFWSIDHVAKARELAKNNPNIRLITFTKHDVSEEYLAQFNGFIIPGGGDSYPSDKEKFGLEDFTPIGEIELAYLDIIEIAYKHQIPFIGMCLGNQYHALSLGKKLTEVQEYASEKEHYGFVVPGTMTYFMTLSSDEQYKYLSDPNFNPEVILKIITAHHFAAVDDNSKIGAYSEEGVVESISNGNHVTFQFHPENLSFNSGMLKFNGIASLTRQMNIFDNYIKMLEQHKEFTLTAKYLNERQTYAGFNPSTNKEYSKMMQKLAKSYEELEQKLQAKVEGYQAKCYDMNSYEMMQHIAQQNLEAEQAQCFGQEFSFANPLEVI